MRRILFTVHELGTKAFGGATLDLVSVLKGLDRTRFRPSVLLTGDTSFTRLLASEGLDDVEMHHLALPPWRKLKHWPRIPFAMRNLERLIRVGRFDIVHTNGGYHDVPYVGVAARRAGVPSLVTIRCFQELCEKFLLYRFPRVDRYILVARAMEELLSRYGIAPHRYRVIYCGVNPPRRASPEAGQEIRRRHDIPAGSFVVGTVANLAPIKGIETLIQAAGLFNQSAPDVVYLLVGGCDSPYRERLNARIADHGLQQKIVFAGYQSDVAPYVSAMDAFVLPSLSEGVPLSILEAMWLECPVIATSVGGVPEALQEGESGLLVPKENPQALAHAMGRLFSDRELGRKLAQRGRRCVEERFSVAQQLDALSAYYEEICGPWGAEAVGLHPAAMTDGVSVP
ncbi:MAG: glycosyltransferase family 4 protein [Nitrospirae bacterium]|nr:glycosyltransferase family 4 protein [Nitrospirota bacterium]